MILLYILLGILLFLLLFLAFIIFVPFKTYIQGSFWEGDLNAMAEVYWIKYIFGARVRFLDMEKLKLLVWFFAIPIPFKISLKKDRKEEDKSKTIEADPEMISIKENEKPEKEKSFREKIDDIINVKDTLIRFYRKNQDDIKKIFVTYVTFSIEYFKLELGLKDPAETGKIAGNLYTALAILPVKRVNLSWNFQKKTFNIDAGLKIIMKFYGIFITLLKLYRFYKKDKKNGIQ